ncbi:hypothetical protein DL96DRAFT_1712662 [Flagelloscypha sp. PMI_526]|nr:hypothetical protein DL96DRAFT_1712662 [Flagelloscypha sp. PMI_526]
MAWNSASSHVRARSAAANDPLLSTYEMDSSHLHSRWPTDATLTETDNPSHLKPYDSPERNSVLQIPSSSSRLAVSYTPSNHLSNVVKRAGPRKLSSRAFIDLIPVLGQSLLMTLTWGFWGYIVGRGYLLLPDGAATVAQQSTIIVTVITTLVGTALSLISTFLFGTAVRNAVVTHISRPISLLVFSMLIRLSTGSFVWRPKHVKWTLATLICTVAINTMTAGWTALLQPAPISISAGIEGTELDLSSAAFSQMLHQASGNLQGLTPSAAILSSIIDASGIAAARTLVGASSTNMISYNGATYNSSTAGILPSGPLQSSGLISSTVYTGFPNFTSGSIPAQSRFILQGKIPHPQGNFAVNISMTQQGFTAAVVCQDLSGQMTIRSKETKLTETIRDTSIGTGVDVGLTKMSWTGQCPSGSGVSAPEFIVSQSSAGGQVVGMLCPSQNFDGKSDVSTHVLLLQGSGDAYSFIPQTACSITPQITTAVVDYSASSMTPSNIYGQTTLNESNAFVGLWAAQSVAARFASTQALRGNSIGDGLLNVREALAESERDSLTRNIMQEYIRGMVEFHATYLRSAYSATGAFPPSDILPITISKPNYGLLKAESWGWTNANAVRAIILMPMTFIALITAFVTMMTYQLFDDDEEIATEEERECKEERERFDPSNPLHLMLASASGGIKLLSGTGSESASDGKGKNNGFEKEKVEENELVEVHFGLVEGNRGGRRRVGFVQDHLQ